ncbi:MAG TPA: vitamin B12-dependent ribonucleotide reductase [Candidatus Sumerlaeota bacterium]|nr:vitamin B12-dependent ribonucleotide reductase [Candidatus Sumerlaeota bacterium]
MSDGRKERFVLLNLKRRFTTPEVHPLDTVECEKRSCVIRNADGSPVFEMHDIEVPSKWSQLASDILISKYIRKAGVSGGREGVADHEASIRQVVGRIARAIRAAGERMGGYFDSPEDAAVFEQEMIWLLLHQYAAFNSPVWFNCGLFDEYGIQGSGGNWAWDEAAGRAVELAHNYERPQCSACFIQSVDDDLMSIFELMKKEARIFKYGSGTGTNFSSLRGRQENLSGGGTSSGVMSFLEVYDRAAGATKSGGTTRRAAKMVCLDADHPEIRDFVTWKSKEEKKVRTLIEAGYPSDFNGEAYHTVSGQNSNNSVRVTDEFMRACQDGGAWKTRFRTTGEVCETFPAADLMREICEAACECADPGLQFHTTINEWHTCPNSGPIRASNPCSEFMFVDDTACNLASINLLKYMGEDGVFDVEGYLQTIRVFTLAQEILVDFSSYPSGEIAANSHRFRPLGLGYANLGALLMVQGLPYDSDGGRAWAAALTAIMTGYAYRVSSEIAAGKGTFEAFEENREPMLKVIRKHRHAVEKINEKYCPASLIESARQQWEVAIEGGVKWGFRNAQVSVLAPTGTIGLLMDCDTTGIEPDYAIVKFKKLAGGGYFKIVNRSVNRALRTLGYSQEQIQTILQYVLGTQELENAPVINTPALLEKGLEAADVRRIEKALHGVVRLEHAFSPHILGHDGMSRLGFKNEDYEKKPQFNLLEALGFTSYEVEEANRVVCGSMTLEGAPHLEARHYPVFDCANRCGALGVRAILPQGHLLMMSAVQPFISGAISKTVNLPNSTTADQIGQVYRQSWELGLKAVAIYRDGSKSSQPLSSKKKEEKKKADLTPVRSGTGQLEMFPELVEGEPRRRFLPQRRGGITVEARVAGHKVYLRTGEYEDGRLGEIFVDMHKEGSTFRSLIMCLSIAVSKGLQYGVPLREFVDTFTYTNFEPRGVCDHPNIKMATSVIDYVFRVLGLEYLGRTEFCQVKPDWEKDRDRATVTAGLGTPVWPRAKVIRGPVVKEPVQLPPEDSGFATRPDLQELKAGAPRNALGGSNGGGAQSEYEEIEKPDSDPYVEILLEKEAQRVTSPVDYQLAEAMGDAPLCDMCGHITVRNGSCYKCLNCGQSMGCS